MPGVWDHDGMDTAVPFQQAKDSHLSGSAPTSFSFAMSAEIALIDFDLT
ncbi:hypothetical protein Geu3261_0160_002 [Komagataeibacter europaeus NBRC 3261]|uniref:Uncharacterized protein n=1 Tax=Komagataeibacter europaeus NBRC 3261 TaxID=1234669 RepID=A0A0D6Q146_KOMEU|nr:hypothetical protein Geu3261_0160_002 [Komagataeibacter europaeus NBRC 3261]